MHGSAVAAVVATALLCISRLGTLGQGVRAQAAHASCVGRLPRTQHGARVAAGPMLVVWAALPMGCQALLCVRGGGNERGARVCALARNVIARYGRGAVKMVAGADFGEANVPRDWRSAML